MNTKTLAYPAVRYAVSVFVGAALILASFAALPVQKAHAAALTEAQISAILGMLTAFNVPQSTIINVSAILHKSK